MFLARCTLLVLIVSGCLAAAQESAQFNVVLDLNYLSAEKTLELYQGLSGHPQEVAQLRGSQIAMATTALLAQRALIAPMLERSLEAAKFNQALDDDVFRMKEARANVAAIKELLTETRRRNFGQKVVSTVEQLFPADVRITTTIPLYFVAFGHNNIDAFVRRVVWKGNIPVFVGEGQGELTIVVNLAKAVYYGQDVDERFLGMMSVVAHELFHAAFGAYKDGSSAWRGYYSTHHTYSDQLFDLAQNEGIAYYLSLIQRSHGNLRPDWLPKVGAAFDEFNKSVAELASPRIMPNRANELIRLSNTSGYWESYGSITGMIIARQIDQTLGRMALVETIARGPSDFFGKYVELMKRDNNFPRLSDTVVRELGRSR